MYSKQQGRNPQTHKKLSYSQKYNPQERNRMLKHKISLQQTIICNNFQIIRERLLKIISTLQTNLKARILKFSHYFTSIDDSLHSQTVERSKPKIEEKSPFDINESFDLERSLLEEMNQSQKGANADLSEEQIQKLKDFVEKYAVSGVKTTLYNESKMMAVLDKLGEKMEKFVGEIVNKHSEHIVTIPGEIEINMQKLNQNIEKVYQDSLKKKEFRGSMTFNKPLIKNIEIDKQDEFKDLYDRLNKQPPNSSPPLSPTSEAYIPISHQLNNMSQNSRISQLQYYSPSQKKIMYESLSEVYRQEYYDTDNSHKITRIKKQYIKQPFFVIQKDEDSVKNSSVRRAVSAHKKIVVPQNFDEYANKSRKRRRQPLKVDFSQQALTVEWCQNVKISYSAQQNLSQNVVPSKQPNIALCLIYLPESFTQNSQEIAIGCRDTNIYIYNTQNYSLTAKLVGHSASICTLATLKSNYFQQDFLLSGADTNCSSVILWEINAWTIHTRINFHEAAITTILPLDITKTTDKIGEYILTGSYDRTFKIFNTSGSNIEYESEILDGPILAACVINNQSERVAICIGGMGIILLRISEKNRQMEKNECSISINIINHIRLDRSILITCMNIIPGSPRILIGTDIGKIYMINTLNMQIQSLDTKGLIKTEKSKNNRNVILSMLVVHRLHKKASPLIVVGCYQSKHFSLINWQTKTLSELSTEVQINLKHSCGINPLLSINQSLQLVVVNQSNHHAISTHQLKLE